VNDLQIFSFGIKSDDIVGRSQTFDAIIKGHPIGEPNVPASFNVLVNNIRGLGLDISIETEEEEDKLLDQ
jgi:DNA-directed RNA polymerase subunit beta